MCVFLSLSLYFVNIFSFVITFARQYFFIVLLILVAIDVDVVVTVVAPFSFRVQNPFYERYCDSSKDEKKKRRTIPKSASKRAPERKKNERKMFTEPHRVQWMGTDSFMAPKKLPLAFLFLWNLKFPFVCAQHTHTLKYKLTWINIEIFSLGSYTLKFVSCMRTRSSCARDG